MNEPDALEKALAAARREVEEYDYWGARHTTMYVALKALIEAVEALHGVEEAS